MNTAHSNPHLDTDDKEKLFKDISTDNLNENTARFADLEAPSTRDQFKVFSPNAIKSSLKRNPSIASSRV
jgi:hypothetical protein